MTDHFDEVYRNTIGVYERNAEEWDKHRSLSFLEKPWVDTFIESIPEGESVLDVGCGSGDPIARYLIERGYTVTGIDSSASMVKICKSKFPEQTWLEGDMRTLNLNQQFHGILAWDSFFHLKHDEQRIVLRQFLKLLVPGGAILLTIGHEFGEVLGTVEGEEVYHSSLAPEEYKDILYDGGVREVQMKLEDPSCGRHSILLARL